ncbi:hypothetical protein ACOSQ2_010415 [Xanthoceras sorbifolium]
MSSNYHLQTDGQTGVVNRVLEQYLRCYAGDQPKNWIDWLPLAKFSYNTSFHSATKITPFEVVYGVPPPGLLSYELLCDRTTIFRELKRNLTLVQERMKKQSDQGRREVQFQVGDFVYLKRHLYRQTSVAFGSSMKLSPRYFGSFEILEKIRQVAYRLALPNGAQIHDVVHVSLLRKHLGDRPVPLQYLPLLQTRRYQPRTKILVKWSGASVEDATWKNFRRFSRTYPTFILADKDTLGRVE